jgi:hypothetical protein
MRFLRQLHHWEFLVGFARPGAKTYLPTKPAGLGGTSLEHSVDESWKLPVHLVHQAGPFIACLGQMSQKRNHQVVI